MLKPPNEPEPTPGDNDRPIGELVHELIEDGKAYARAEVGLVKAIATAKANALKIPAILFGIAFLLALAAITALAVGVAMGLATLIGPLAGGIVAFLLFAAVAGGLAWYGVEAPEGGPMTRELPEVPAARVEAERARAQLMDTASACRRASAPAPWRPTPGRAPRKRARTSRRTPSTRFASGPSPRRAWSPQSPCSSPASR